MNFTQVLKIKRKTALKLKRLGWLHRQTAQANSWEFGIGYLCIMCMVGFAWSLLFTPFEWWRPVLAILGFLATGYGLRKIEQGQQEIERERQSICEELGLDNSWDWGYGDFDEEEIEIREIDDTDSEDSISEEVEFGASDSEDDY